MRSLKVFTSIMCILMALYFHSCTKILLNRKSGVKIIAHRGYWDIEYSAQNSLASIQKAYELGVDGIELDVSITADDSLVVVHGPNHGSLTITQTDYDVLNKIPLENGEKIPTLRECLLELKSYPELDVFLDIKIDTHIFDIYQLVASITNNTCYYMSFSLPVCCKFREFDVNNNVLYIGGTYSPQELVESGISGFSYSKETLNGHPEFLSAAKSLGLITSVWTVNGKDELNYWLAQSDLDFITTDTPDIINLKD